MRIGPFDITPVLELSHLGVDTNVFNSSVQPQSDFTVSGGPRIDIVVPLQRFTFVAETATELVYYSQFQSQRGVNFDMTLRGEVQTLKLAFFIEDSFLNTRARPNFEIDTRARRLENEIRGGLTVDVFRKLEVELAADQSIREYSDDDLVGASFANLLNRDVTAATGAVRYAATPLTTLSFRSEVSEELFPLSPTRDHKSWSLIPGVEFNPRAIISGNAEVGYRKIRGLDEALPDFDGPVASVDLSYSLLGATTIGFTASRGIEFSLDVIEPYYVAAGFGVSVRHQITSPIGISVATERFNLGYRRFESGFGSNALEGRIDSYRRNSVTLHRRLSRTTEMGFNVSYVSRHSDSRRSRTYDGMSIGMTMTYAF